MDFSNYLIDIDNDCDLITEAISTLENTFKYKSEDELQHRNRPDALAYICLINLKERGIVLRKRDTRLGLEEVLYYASRLDG